MNHSEIQNHWLVKDDDGNVLAINTVEFAEPKLVFTKSSVSDEWFDVLRASAAMYQQLTHQYESLQSIIELGEIAGIDEQLLRFFGQMQNGIMLAQQVAQQGTEKVARSIEAQKKMS